jgi:hypothetical protein
VANVPVKVREVIRTLENAGWRIFARLVITESFEVEMGEPLSYPVNSVTTSAPERIG